MILQVASTDNQSAAVPHGAHLDQDRSNLIDLIEAEPKHIYSFNWSASNKLHDVLNFITPNISPFVLINAEQHDSIRPIRWHWCRNVPCSLQNNRLCQLLHVNNLHCQTSMKSINLTRSRVGQRSTSLLYTIELTWNTCMNMIKLTSQIINLQLNVLEQWTLSA